MLRYEQDEVESRRAEAARVTPEELTQALADIEARRQAEASRIAGTIPLNQAVSELQLDSTSAEIWAEVQAQRDRAAAAEHERVQQERAARQAARQTVFAQRPRRRRGWTGFLAPLLVLWVLAHNGLIPHFWGHSTHMSAPILQSLAQVPEGKEVYATDAALDEITQGKPAAQIIISENPTGNRWTLVKIGRHVYLRGYIVNTDSLQQLQGNALHVYNDANSGELDGIKTSHITLRVDNVDLKKSGGDDGFSEITVPHFQPDAFTTVSPGR